MTEWDDLSAEINDTVGTRESIIKLLHRIAEKIDSFDYARDEQDVTDDMMDMALALRAKAEELADAALHQSPPDVIHLPNSF